MMILLSFPIENEDWDAYLMAPGR